MEDNKINNNQIKKDEPIDNKPSQKYETIREAMDRGLSYEEALFGD